MPKEGHNSEGCTLRFPPCSKFTLRNFSSFSVGKLENMKISNYNLTENPIMILILIESLPPVLWCIIQQVKVSLFLFLDLLFYLISISFPSHLGLPWAFCTMLSWGEGRKWVCMLVWISCLLQQRQIAMSQWFI